jgi:hypothetical protein
MDAVFQELIKALPWGFVLIAMQYLNLRNQEKERQERAANLKDADAQRASNAAEKAKVERDFEMEKNKLWAETIKTVLDRQTEASQSIVGALLALKEDLQKKYDSMGITKDLLDAARRELGKRKSD